MTSREQKIHALVADLRRVLDGKRTVTLFAGAGHGSSDLAMISAVNEAVAHASHVARQVYDAAIADHKSEADAKAEGAEAYMFALPELSHVASVRCYIACVAHGVKRGYIPGQQARLLLYTAQLQLAAMTRKVVA